MIYSWMSSIKNLFHVTSLLPRILRLLPEFVQLVHFHNSLCFVTLIVHYTTRCFNLCGSYYGNMQYKPNNRKWRIETLLCWQLRGWFMFGVLEFMGCWGTSLLHPFSLLVTVDFYPSLSVNIWLISMYDQCSYLTISFAVFTFYLSCMAFMMCVIRLHPVPTQIILWPETVTG
jgi:hypothetical protein